MYYCALLTDLADVLGVVDNSQRNAELSNNSLQPTLLVELPTLNTEGRIVAVVAVVIVVVITRAAEWRSVQRSAEFVKSLATNLVVPVLRLPGTKRVLVDK
jgi:hypothetical protein